MDYAVIVNNEIKGLVPTDDRAQVFAKALSNGKYDEAKIIHLPSLSLEGHWIKGERVL